MNQNILTAILSMDSYNRGYGASINLPVFDSLGEFYWLGDVQILATSTTKFGSGVDSAVNFYGVAYTHDGETIISYRGTDSFGSWTNLWTDGDVWNGWSVGAGSTQSRQAELAFQFKEKNRDTIHFLN